MDEELIFDQLTEVPPAEWETRLDLLCNGDTALRRRVLQLLRAYHAYHEALDTPAVEHILGRCEVPEPEYEGAHVGAYKLLQQIGEGGMGNVFMAEQTEPIKRLVAVKLIKPGLDSRETINRFEVERQALAMMDHPNIAKVLDAGTAPSGRPFFVMELVRGSPITDYSDRQRLTVRERVALLISVCQAVQHAHQKGIVHRDLKPSNVLIACFDETPIPKVIDFGVAKAVDRGAADESRFTRFGQVVGTPEYMSPEQVCRTQSDVDSRSDVYSIGVLLYELVTGTTPFSRYQLHSTENDEMARIIRDVEPERPSVRLRTVDNLPLVAANRNCAVNRLEKSLRGDLDWITMRAMEKDRSRRYQTAAQLADDLQRFLDDQPVSAGPPSWQYQISKFVRRNARWVAVAGLLCTTLMLGIIGTVAGWMHARKAAFVADAARTQTQMSADRLRREVYSLDMLAAGAAWQRGDLRFVDRTLRKHEGDKKSEDLRRWEWYFLRGLIERRGVSAAMRLDPAPYRIEVSPNGEWLAASHSRSRVATLIHLESGEVRAFGSVPQSVVWNPAFAVFSPDSSQIAMSGEAMGSVHLLDVSDGTSRVIRAPVEDDTILNAAFSPDGETLALISVAAGVELIELSSVGPDAMPERRMLFSQKGRTGNVLALAFSPNGRQLVAGLTDETLRLWDLDSPGDGLVLVSTAGLARDAAFSPDGKQIAVASTDGTVRVWHSDGGTSHQQLFRSRDEGRAVAFSPDGSQIAVGFRDRTVRLWNVADFEMVDELHGYEGIYAVAFGPDGDLWFGGQNSELVRWPVSAIDRDVVPRLSAEIDSLVFAADNRTVYAATTDLQNQISSIDITSGRGKLRQPIEMPFRVSSVSGDSDGHLVVTDADRFRCHVLSETDPENCDIVDIPIQSKASAAAISSSSRLLALGGADGTLAVWNRSARRLVWSEQLHTEPIRVLKFDPTGEMLLSGGWDRRLVLVRPKDGSIIHDFGRQDLPVCTTAFSPSADSITAGLFGPGFAQSRLIEWKLPEFNRTQHMGNPFSVTGLAYLRDGQTIVSVAEDQTLRLLDRVTGRERLLIDCAPRILQSIAVSSDDRIVVAGCRDGSILIFRSALPELSYAKRSSVAWKRGGM